MLPFAVHASCLNTYTKSSRRLIWVVLKNVWAGGVFLYVAISDISGSERDAVLEYSLIAF